MHRLNASWDRKRIITSTLKILIGNRAAYYYESPLQYPHNGEKLLKQKANFSTGNSIFTQYFSSVKTKK